ncbi:hypothetical protein GDO86_010354 [Hymenochirus boettgeri]|uniref:Alpha 1,4-glycosyltransferase domain-containing protein n=1 Tax=Hymenochirus boettgeri TaxID=247094 RepID=A0A8T2JK57_9PIPI|nr:hypothetical protein GDO86_010354 [Hymenochirus boettgeri]
MSSPIKVCSLLLAVMVTGFLYGVTNKERTFSILPFFSPATLNPGDILEKGNGIIFIESTDRMDPPSLVLCAVESAARVYPDRPVAFFMKGLPDINSVEDQDKARNSFPTLAPYSNIHLYPLRMEVLFNNTPLMPWYQRVNPRNEIHWIHVSSDACRLALIYKYGGLYMDTDIISARVIPEKNFLAAESSQISSNGVFGFVSNHTFTWNCMENFVQNYNGAIWGHQGPALFTRVLKQFYCTVPPFIGKEDLPCGDISFLNPQRFYPISFNNWKQYFEVWQKIPTFDDSYALHLFNYANRGEKMVMIPRTKTLVEHLYQQYCPATYKAVLENNRTHLS